VIRADTNDLPSLLAVAVDAASTAGAMVRNRIDDDLLIELKEEGNYNLVTEMDRASEDLIRSMVTSAVPGSRFLAEESGGDWGLEELTWVVDPIDGTVNYAHGIPIYAVSIAAVRHGRPIVGAIYGPGTNELFTATLGGGSFVDGKRMNVSTTSALRHAVLVSGFPYNVGENPFGCIDTFASFLRRGIPVRRLGSAALDLAYVAAGRFDAFWEVALAPWDVAAGILMITEAGGSVVTYGDNSRQGVLITDRILATNGLVESEMLSALQTAGSIQSDR